MHQILYSSSAQKELRKLPKQELRRIIAKIEGLALQPRPDGVKKLQGFADLYRIRQGNYRVIYQVNDATITVLIVGVGNRKDIYKK